MNQELISADGKINYANVIAAYPWIVERNRKCILSPDSDGLLCGLLMQHLLGWNICGFYDGKVMALRDGVLAKDCVFLDMEIFRDFTRSIGQHMLMNNARHDKLRLNWVNFVNCISPNNLRSFDRTHNFKQKYPLGTIHLLLGIVGSKFTIPIKKEAICPLMYTDGTFKNIFNYPDNALDWLAFLCADNKLNPLYQIFFNNSYTTSDLMFALKDIFQKISDIGGRHGDGITISDSHGEPSNLISMNDGNLAKIDDGQQDVARKFLNFLDELTGWKYDNSKWSFDNLRITRFQKGIIDKPQKGSGGLSVAKQYDEMLGKNPISWAITKKDQVQYTLETERFE